MKPIHALAVLGALAAGPALAQEYPPGPVGQPQDQLGLAAESGQQAVQPQFLAQIQQQLQSQGLYDGPVDGLYGEQTRAALAEWQRQQGLQPTGQLNAQTLAAMDVDAMATQQAEVPEPEGRTERRQEFGTPPDSEQQAREPEAEQSTSDLETLRDEKMSAPNVEGETVPERPETGTPAPGQSPESLEQPPRD